MGARTKTSVEISDEIAPQAKALAAREHTTLRHLIEAGLRAVLRERRGRGRFRLKAAAFRGRGLPREFRGAGWDRIREAACEGRGG